jgi:hypothetical protein
MIHQSHIDLLQNSKPYQNWVKKYSQNILNSSFQNTKITCDTISVENIQPYKRGKECFATLLANSKPSTFPKRLCINKPNITVLLILTGKSWSQSPDEEWVLMTAQTQLGTGYRWNFQLPNGEFDQNGDFSTCSGQDLQSSLGFIIKQNELTHLGLPYHFYQNNYHSVFMTNNDKWKWLYDDTSKITDLVQHNVGWYSQPKSNTEYTNFYTAHRNIPTLNDFTQFLQRIERINDKSDYLKYILVPKAHVLDYSLDIKTGHVLSLYQQQFIVRKKNTLNCNPNRSAKCININSNKPLCKYGVRCKRFGCIFSHPEGREINFQIYCWGCKNFAEATPNNITTSKNGFHYCGRCI